MGQEHSSFSSNGNEITVTYTKRPRSSTTVKRTTPSNTTITDNNEKERSPIDPNREPLLGLPITKHHESIPNRNLSLTNYSDETTWSEMSSSIGTVALLQESYHSNSLTGDSGVDCQDISTIKSTRTQQRFHDLTTTSTIPIVDDDDDDDDESFMNYSTHPINGTLYVNSRKYDSDTALSRGVLLQDTRKNNKKQTNKFDIFCLCFILENATESHVLSYMSTENGLDRALEQTSRFYSDLEHIATDLNILTKRYSQSQTTMSPALSRYYHQQQQYHRPGLNTIDALDWDWNDAQSPPFVQSPKTQQRKDRQQYSSSLPRLNSNNKNKVRRRLNQNNQQTDYNESDLEIRTTRSYDCTSSPLRRSKTIKITYDLFTFSCLLGPSSVYFDSTDNTSGEDHFGDETLQIPSSPSVLTSSRTTEFFATMK